MMNVLMEISHRERLTPFPSRVGGELFELLKAVLVMSVSSFGWLDEDDAEST